MEHVLHTFHPAAKRPEKENELYALYHSVMQGKRILLLMDNAKDAAQVHPLVPPPGSTLLVTSRNHFHLEKIYGRNLDALPPTDAKAMLLEIAPRISTEAEAIAKLCGYLPQALRLAATAIAEGVDLNPLRYRERLEDEKNRLKMLRGERDSVEASIALSYALLDVRTRELWCMLAVFPDTFDTSAAATVWELKADPAQDRLSYLLKFSMLEWNTATNRYRLHDLMRAFANQLLSEAEFRALSSRHAKHYFDVILGANTLYKRGGASLISGLGLFDQEWGNIQSGHAWAAVCFAADVTAATVCSRYADYGTSIFSLRQHPRERIRWLEIAIAASRLLNDRKVEGVHLGNLGIAYKNLGEFRRAIELYRQRLPIARETNDRRGEGAALLNLGVAHANLGETDAAVRYYKEALEIAREIHDLHGEGAALGNLGSVYNSLHDYRSAVQYQEQHLDIARKINDRRGEGSALGNLGLVYQSLGDVSRAIFCFEQHLAIAREVGHRQGEGNALGNLGSSYASLGVPLRAIEYFEQSLSSARTMDDRQGEASALFNLSLALSQIGKREEAVEHAEAALKIYKQIEDPNAGKVRKQLALWHPA